MDAAEATVADVFSWLNDESAILPPSVTAWKDEGIQVATALGNPRQKHCFSQHSSTCAFSICAWAKAAALDVFGADAVCRRPGWPW